MTFIVTKTCVMLVTCQALSSVSVLTHLILTMTPRGRTYDCPYFTNEKTEAESLDIRNFLFRKQKVRYLH